MDPETAVKTATAMKLAAVNILSGEAESVVETEYKGDPRAKVPYLEALEELRDMAQRWLGTGELPARMRVALRHAAALRDGARSAGHETGKIRVDLAARLVYLDGKEVHLTPNDYKLLAALVRHAGKVLTHRHLPKQVWGAKLR